MRFQCGRHLQMDRILSICHNLFQSSKISIQTNIPSLVRINIASDKYLLNRWNLRRKCLYALLELEIYLIFFLRCQFIFQLK